MLCSKLQIRLTGKWLLTFYAVIYHTYGAKFIDSLRIPFVYNEQYRPV